MNAKQIGINQQMWRRAGVKLLQAAALALVVTLAMPARAADERAHQVAGSAGLSGVGQRMKISGVVRVEATVDADER